MLRRPILSTELVASRLAFEDRIYVVGSFATGVSFASQQRRVMSLVCSIDEDLKRAGEPSGLKNRTVCIVGAGLAGLTCAAAVAALEGSAHVIDQNAFARGADGADDPSGTGYALSTVAGACHRDAHPSINFWPQEELEPVTRLPLLNWHEGSCDDVAGQILGEYGAYGELPKAGHRLKGLKPGRKLKALKRLDNGKWSISCEKLSDGLGDWTIDFDIVILAVGFGLEKEEPNCSTPRYWDYQNDVIPGVRRQGGAEFEHLIVSGTGDGGLIETLRLLFTDMRAGRIDDAMANALSDDVFKDATLAVENKVHKLYRDNVLHDPIVPISDVHKDEISKLLWAGYCSLVINHVSPVLAKSLHKRRAGDKKIILLGQRPTPLELSAAPYHRILITAAIGMGRIQYIQVKDVLKATKEDEVPLSWDRDGATVTQQVQRTKVEVEALDSIGFEPSRVPRFEKPLAKLLGPQSFARSFVVVRHGYVSPLESIFNVDRDVIARVRLQQALFADQDHLDPDYARALAKGWDLPDPANTADFAKRTFPVAERYFDLQFGLRAAIEDDDPDLRIVLYARPDRDPDDEPPPERAPRGSAKQRPPSKIWGVEVLNSDSIVAPPTGGASGGDL